MPTRTTMSFARPFMLEGYDQELPAGEYVVETDEELIQGLSCPAYRRPGQKQAWIIDPKNLDAALVRDQAAA